MTAAVVGAFVATFVLVCALVYWLLASREAPVTAEPALTPTRRIARTIGLIVVGTGITLACIALILQGAKWTLFPVMDALAPILLDIFLRPGGAALLALVVILAGIPLSRRVRRRDRFRAGIALIALALVTFWPMQYLAASRTMPFPEFTAGLHWGAFFISLTLFAAGLETLRRSWNTPKDDASEL